MSAADTIRATAIGLVGSPYVLGNEAYYDDGWEPSSHPTATDCSGLVFACYRRAGVLWRSGVTWPRLTAHGYWERSIRLTAPTRIGDCAYFLGTSGHAYHVALYIGDGETVEARGRRWGVVRYRLNDPIHGVDRRGCVWGRFPWVELVEPPPPVEEDDMTDDERKWLHDLRHVVAPKQSYVAAITNALLVGDKSEAQRLNDEFWRKWPAGVSGLPKGWEP